LRLKGELKMEKRHSFCRLSIFIALAVFAFNLKNAAFAAVPNPPTLTSPSNGSNAGGTVVQFRWTQVADATNYYLQVATDSGFTSIIFGQWIGNYIGMEKKYRKKEKKLDVYCQIE